jgi:hypothetical protein
VVNPGEDIQAALDSLPEEGGCVCLKTGVHKISEPLRIHLSNVVLRGESPSTCVQSTNLINLLDISQPEGAWIENIAVENIRFEIPGLEEAVPEDEKSSSMVWLNRCRNIKIRSCFFGLTGEQPIPFVGMWAMDAEHIAIENNHIHSAYGIWAWEVKNFRIFDNVIQGLLLQVSDLVEIPFGWWGIRVEAESNWPCNISGNHISDFWTGIYLGDGPRRSVIAGNEIFRPTLSPEIYDYDENSADAYFHYAIDIEASMCTIRNNYIELSSPIFAGIRIKGEKTNAVENMVRSYIYFDPGFFPSGIFLCPGVNPELAAHGGSVCRNTLMGMQNAISISQVTDVRVMDNRISGHDQQARAIMVENSLDTIISSNLIEEVSLGIGLKSGMGNQVRQNQISQSGYGIVVQEESEAVLTGNVVHNVKNAGIGALMLTGSITIAHSHLFHCGYEGLAVGIGVLYCNGDVCIESCEVLDTGISTDQTQNNLMPNWGISVFARSCRIVGNRVAYSDTVRLDPDLEHRALLLVGPLSYSASLHYMAALRSGVKEFATGSALVLNNFFSGPGRSHLVQFRRIQLSDVLDLRFEKIIFSNNSCEHLDASAQEDKATVLLWGSHLIAMGNHIKAGPRVNAMDLSNRGKIALMGNVTTGDYINTGATKPTLIGDYNVQI